MGIKHPDNHKAYHTDVCDPDQDSLEMILRIRFADEKDAQPSFSTEVHGKTIAVTFSCGKVGMFVAIDAARFKERMVDIVQLFYGKWLRQQGRDDEAPEAIITRGREWYVYASYGYVVDEELYDDKINYCGVFAFKPIDCGVAWTKEELKYRKSQFLKLNAPILLEDGEFSAVTVGTPNTSIRIVDPRKPWMSGPWEYWVEEYPDRSDAFFRFFSAPAPEKDFKGKKEVLITDSFAARHIGTSGGDGYQVIIGEEEMGLSMEAICSLVDGYRARGMDVMICNDEKDESRCITYGTGWISKDIAPARAYQLDVCSTALLSVDVMDEKKPAIILRPQVEWFSNTDEARDKLWHKAHTSYSGYEYTELDSSLCNGTSFISGWEPLTTAYMNILTHEGALNEKGKAVRKTFNIDKLTRDDRLRLDVEMAYGDEERQAYCRTALLEYLLKKKGLGSLSGEINKLPDNEAEIWRLADILDIPITAGVRQRWLLKKGVDSLSATQIYTALNDLVTASCSNGCEYMISSNSRYYADNYYLLYYEVGSGSPGCSIDQYGKRYGTLEEFATALILNFAEGRLTVSDEALMDNGYIFMILHEIGTSPDALNKLNPSSERRLEIMGLSAKMVNKITRDIGIEYKTVSDTLCAMRVADKLPFTLADLKDLRDSGWDYDFSYNVGVGKKIYSFLFRTGRSQKVLMKLINSDNLRAVKYAYDIACGMRDCQTRKMVLDAYHERFQD